MSEQARIAGLEELERAWEMRPPASSAVLEVYRFTIPGRPISKNAMHRAFAFFARNGKGKPDGSKRPQARIIESERYRTFKHGMVTIAFQENLPQIRSGRWEIRTISYWPEKRHLEELFPYGDSDASIIAVRDGLQHAKVIDDDVRIVRSIGESAYSKTNPRIEVELRRLS